MVMGRQRASAAAPRGGVAPYIGLGALGASLYVLNALQHRSLWVDDSYIAYRYARNLAAGLGMVFNPGDRLEGLTDLAWAILMAPFADTDPLPVARLLSLLFGVGVVILLAGWAWRERLPPLALAVALAPWVLLPWAPSWSMMGMETVAVAFFVTLAWTRYRVEAEDPDRWPLSAIGLGLAPAFHPIGGTVIIAVLAWHLVRPGDRLSPQARRAFVVVLLLGLLLVAAKLWWFGALVPHTFSVKTRPWPWPNGVAYLKAFATIPSPVFACVLAPCLLHGLSGLVRRRDRVLPSLVAALVLAAAWAVNGDMFFNFRILIHGLPAMGAAMALAVAALPRRAALLGGLIALASTLPARDVLIADGLARHRGEPTLIHRQVSLVQAWRQGLEPPTIAEIWPYPAAWVLTHAPPGTTVAFTDIGLFSYANDHRVVDLLGLVTEEMAVPWGAPREDTWARQRSWLAENVDYVILDQYSDRYRRLALHRSEDFIHMGACGTIHAFASRRAPPPVLDEPTRRGRTRELVRRLPTHTALHVAVARELAWVAGPEEAMDLLERSRVLAAPSWQVPLNGVATELSRPGEVPAGCGGFNATWRIPFQAGSAL